MIIISPSPLMNIASFNIEPSAITVAERDSVSVCVRLTDGQISVPTEIKIEWSTDILVTPSNPLAGKLLL